MTIQCREAYITTNIFSIHVRRTRKSKRKTRTTKWVFRDCKLILSFSKI